jgi:hypothetical protein
MGALFEPLLGNFQPTRIFVNPKFLPSLILGQWRLHNGC